MVWLRISIVPMASVPEATWLRRDLDSRNEKLLGPTRGSRRLRSSRSSESSSHVRGFKELGRGLPSIRTSWTPAPRPPIPRTLNHNVHPALSFRCQVGPRESYAGLGGGPQGRPSQPLRCKAGALSARQIRPRARHLQFWCGYPIVREHDMG